MKSWMKVGKSAYNLDHITSVWISATGNGPMLGIAFADEGEPSTLTGDKAIDFLAEFRTATGIDLLQEWGTE